MTDPETRLHLFFATENDRAVILLRTARNLYRLILWHRDTDSFEDGQWIRRQLYPDSCDLTPDGRYFMFSVDGRWTDTGTLGGHTAISQPPYFTAVGGNGAYFVWAGRGRFVTNTLFEVSGQHQLDDRLAGTPGLQPVMRGEITKDCRTGLRLLGGQPAPLTKVDRDRLLDGQSPPDPKLLDRYDTTDGALHRRHADGTLTLIRDFRGMEFEALRAPYDDRADTPQGVPAWHPANGDAR